jgi:hypothetical protein
MSTPSKNPPRKWTEEEDNCLRTVVERMGPRNWKEIARHVPDRSHVQCLQRWNKVLRPGLKKGTWQAEEDEKLMREVNGFLESGGEVNWTTISKCIEGRTAKQCRERWRCNLDPNINKTEWTQEEDLMIINLQQELGNRWALLAKSLPGRTENSIKTRFRSLQRSTKRKWTPQEDSMLMQMIRSGSNFSEVAQVMTRRSLNSVRVRYKQLTEGSQVPALSPPRASSHTPIYQNLLPAPFLQQAFVMEPELQNNFSVLEHHPNLKRLHPSDFEDDNSKLLKMDAY